jgi:hypothetical protein
VEHVSSREEIRNLHKLLLLVVLGIVVASALVIRPMVFGFSPGQDDGFLRTNQEFSLADIIPPWFSIFTYHLEYEQYACWWPQFRDAVSPPST